jgi:phospholipid/cholesterol/gamma-HCH transport system substrate-binding protein
MEGLMRRLTKMKKKSSEMWVGIFVVIGILLLVGLTLKVEKFQIGREAGYLVNIYFDSAAGLDRSAAIRVAGVHVGNVEKVALEEGRAKVTFRLPPNIILYKDSKAYLKSEGFLGEKYVEISPGTPGYPRVPPNGEIEQGAPPADIEQFLSKVGELREDIKDVTRPLGEVLKAVDAKKIEGMIDNLNKFSSQMTGIGDDAKVTIQKAKDAFSRMEEIGDKVNKGEGTLGKLITDDSVYEEAKKTVETAKEAAESAKKAVETLKNISETIERGEGTLGKLIKDESLYKDAKETLQTVKGIAEKVEKGEGTLGKLVSDDKLVKEAEKTMKKVQKAAEGIEEQTPITVLGTIIGIFF